MIWSLCACNDYYIAETFRKKQLDVCWNTHYQRENTRGDRLLDFYITNRPTLIKTVKTVPSISDHDGAIVVGSDILGVLNKKLPRKVFVFSKAKRNSMRTDIMNFTSSFLETYMSNSVQVNWNNIKTSIENTMNANIPTRTTSMKNHKPWLISDIWRLSRRKHRLYRRAKSSGKASHLLKFQNVTKLSSKQVKKARVNFINKRAMSEPEDGNIKPFWLYTKSLRQEGIGIP